jgi:hypothetical protein
MSDFGIAADVVRSDGKDATDTDRARVSAAIRQLRVGSPDRIDSYDHLKCTVCPSFRVNGPEGISITLTEYWFDEQGEDSKTIVEHDRPSAQQFCNDLQRLLGNVYHVEMMCGEW